ncbi:MAG: asparagine synthase (glutamine-hydrolyzing) [Sulfuritalea sp.]|nr:asparagine synthase (glutamine-hydrolyzing) [Sulfuritalea sp.]
MCRISGLIDGRSCQDKELRLRTLRAMRDSMHAGGPDDAGEYLDDDISLGHRRLSIIDTSSLGHQPYLSPCRRYVLVYNGELYNFREVRDELRARGRVFRSESDTEVLLYGLIEWGVECLHQFRGMFAFAFYDKESKQLLLGRDRAGVKPLFYFHDGRSFGFASELKAFHAIQGFSRKVDEYSRSLYFKYGYVPAPHSIYQGVSKLAPGHVLHVDVRDPGKQSLIQYWDVRAFYARPRSSLSYAEAVDCLEELLIDSFKLRMIADVPVGMFLSGGVDSSAVVALLARHTSSTVRTFTIGFDEAGFDEAPHAREVASYFGTDHHEHMLGRQDCCDIIPRLPGIWDEPFGDSSQIPTLLVAEFARKYVKVSLSADGGDETFYGYPKYWLTESRHRLIDRFSWLLKPLRSFGDPRLRCIGRMAGVDDKLAKAVSAANDGVGLIDTFSIGEEVFSPMELTRLFGGGARWRRFDESFGLGAWSIDNPVDQMLAVDYRTYLVDDILCKVDRATMAVGLEGREPLLDHKIIEFAATLPLEYKRAGGTTKRILRDVLYRYAPQQLIERPKMGFGVPVEKWMKEVPQLRERLEWHFSPAMLARSGFEDTKMVGQLLANYLQRGMSFKKVWLIYSYQTWFDRWAQ